MNDKTSKPTETPSESEGPAQPTVRSADQSAAQLDKPTSENSHPIAGIVGNYLQVMRGIGATAQIVLPHTAKWIKSESETLEKKLLKYLPGFPDINKEGRLELKSAREVAEFSNALRAHSDIRSNNAPAVLSRALFMQMFSEFDAFTGHLLKAVYLRNDALLKGISREISLSDLLAYSDINSVKWAMLEKEIDSFRRDSYIEQFASLEKKFGLTLKKFPEWGEFVELSQRRNIFTHNGGVTSDQYLSVCEREGYRFSKQPAIGEKLSVGFAYFMRALNLLSKVALMLGYTLWAKVFPKDLEVVHARLNETIYKCLEQKRWKFVSEIQDFVLSDPMRKGLSEIDLRIRIVNISIGLKFSERQSECVKLLHSVDWSASYRDFKLAIAVLSDNFEEASALMRNIGKSGEIIRQDSYHTWPLFARFREESIFFQTYEQIYDESFMEQVRREADSAAEQTARDTELKEAPRVGSNEDADAERAEPSKLARKRSTPASLKKPSRQKIARTGTGAKLNS